MQRIFILIIISIVFASCAKKFGKDEMRSFDSDEKEVQDLRVSYLQSEIRKHPDVIGNYVVLADIKISEGKIVEAGNLLKSVYAKAPENPRVISGLAACYIADEEYTKALALMRLAGARGVQSLGIYKNMAKVCYMTGKFEQSLFYLNRALQIDNNDWELFLLKAEIARVDLDTAEVYKYYEIAYELNPSDTVYNKLFDLAMDQGDMSRSSKYINKQFIRHPGSPDLLYRAGRYYRLQGQVDTSYYLYHKLTDMEPDNIRGYNELANGFYEQAKYDSAIFYADHALQIDPKAIKPHLVRARTLEKQYRYTDASLEYLTILEVDSTFTIAVDELRKLNRKVAYLQSLKKYKKSKEEMKLLKPLKTKSLN